MTKFSNKALFTGKLSSGCGSVGELIKDGMAPTLQGQNPPFLYFSSSCCGIWGNPKVMTLRPGGYGLSELRVCKCESASMNHLFFFF